MLAKKAEKESEKARERAEYLQRSVEQIPVTNEKQLKKLENLFNRLEQYYPEHAVFALDSLNENFVIQNKTSQPPCYS